MSSVLAHPITITIGLAGLLFAVAGLSFLANALLAQRGAVSRRVDRLIDDHPVDFGRRPLAEKRSPARTLLIGAGTLEVRDEAELVRRFRSVGVPADRAIAAFFVCRLSLGVIFAVALSLTLSGYGSPLPLPLRMAVLAIFGGAAGWLLPLLVLGRLAVRRMHAVERGLPDAIELLVVSVEAGLALEDSLDRMVPELRRSQPALAEELGQTAADLKILPSREVALGKLAERVPAPSVRSVVTTLSQTLRYGTPLAQALRIVASELRNDALIKLEERANRLPALMTIPMILFILPALFIVIAGPAVLRLIDAYGQ